MFNIIGYLKACKYDFMPLCNADGVTDDSQIIQRRMDHGLDPFKAKGMKNGFLINKPINVDSNFVFNGKDIG